MAKKQKGLGRTKRLLTQNPAKTAREALRPRLALRQSRHEAKSKNQTTLIHSVGTFRTDRDALTNIVRWLQEQGLNLNSLTPEKGCEYINMRLESGLQPKTVNKDLRVLQNYLGQKLNVKITLLKPENPRAYQVDEVLAVVQHLSEKHALSTKIAYAAGLRAHELLTIDHPELQPPSKRDWVRERFEGRTGVIYTVKGKGGLIREILIPTHLATELEKHRLETPVRYLDREILYQSHYSIGAGKNWSAAFSRASREALGWSSGAHGLRHAYAQNRVFELQASGYLYSFAKQIVSQELGHFRPDITDTYLR